MSDPSQDGAGADDLGRTAAQTTPLPAAGVETVLADRYRLTALIGRGGMADVYRAEDQLLHRPVAVKIFRGGSDAAASGARWHSEIRLLAGLSDPGLVTVFDAGSEPASSTASGASTPFLVMELVDGRTLGDLIDDGPLTPHVAAAVGRQIAAALAYVHDRGIVHRDVKPANILLADPRPEPGSPAPAGSAVPSVKLADFGLARIAESARLTSHGMTVGTANYLSPEQAMGHQVTPAADVYSLGLVLLECRTGQLAFPGHGVEAALARLQRDPLVPESLGPQWVGLLKAMTARTPGYRPTAHEVAQRLASMVTEPARGTGVSLSAVSDRSTDELGPLPGVRWTTPLQNGPALAAARTGAPAHTVAEQRRRHGSRGLLAMGALAAAAVLIGALAIVFGNESNGPSVGTVPSSVGSAASPTPSTSPAPRSPTAASSSPSRGTSSSTRSITQPTTPPSASVARRSSSTSLAAPGAGRGNGKTKKVKPSKKP